MTKFISCITLAACGLLLASGLSSCDLPYSRPKAKLSKVEDLNSSDFKLGLPMGAKAMYVGEQNFPKARPAYYNSHYAAYEALASNKIDAYLFDSHTLEYVAANTPGYTILPGTVGRVDIAIGLASKNVDLLAPINEFIRQYKKSGTYDAMYTRWISNTSKSSLPKADDDEDEAELGVPATTAPAMPKIAAPESPTRKLIVGTCSQLEPLCFRVPDNEEIIEEGSTEKKTNLTGFDIELLRRLALFLNANIEIRDMDYTTLENQLADGKIDMVVAGMNKTTIREDRNILFSNNYIESRIVALVKTERFDKADD